MTYRGSDAVKYLSGHLSADDNVSSAHWRYYHSDFGFDSQGNLRGIKGFGGSARPYTGVRRILHHLFQRKYRRMARTYDNFDSLDKLASLITHKQQRAYDLDVLRQALTLAMISSHLPYGKGTCAIVIGDGFASLSTLMLASKIFTKVILINLTKTLLVDLVYFSKWAESENASFSLVTDKEGLKRELNSDSNLIALQASHHKLLSFVPAEVVVNIASMQEMRKESIREYFSAIRKIANDREVLFYCCNREQKVLPDGTITRFSDYPWLSNDQILFDSLCPWHQQYYTIIPPRYLPYDGPIRHRLINLKGSSK